MPNQREQEAGPLDLTILEFVYSITKKKGSLHCHT